MDRTRSALEKLLGRALLNNRGRWLSNRMVAIFIDPAVRCRVVVALLKLFFLVLGHKRLELLLLAR